MELTDDQFASTIFIPPSTIPRKDYVISSFQMSTYQNAITKKNTPSRALCGM